MHACLKAIAITVLLAGCDKASRSIAGPLPPGPQADIGSYSVSGLVHDIDGSAIPGAVVTLENQGSVRTAESNESGQFRFEGIRGLETSSDPRVRQAAGTILNRVTSGSRRRVE